MLNMFTNEIVPNLYMLCRRLQNRIFSEVNSTHVVTKVMEYAHMSSYSQLIGVSSIAVDNAIVLCFLLVHDTSEHPSKLQHPLVLP